MTQTLLFGAIAGISELCCIVADIDLDEIQDSSAKSNFHWKTMKCRLIIHKMQSAVIASPAYQTITSIHVITTVEFFKSEILQKHLKEINVACSTPRPVTPDIYGNCLRYTIQFNLAPLWNKAGQFFILGKHFLSISEEVSALRFDFSLRMQSQSKVDARLRLQSLKVKLFSLKLEDLNIPSDIIADFMADPEGFVDVTSFGSCRATVLPSLKRGIVTAVFKKIPKSCPFENYTQLRRHWKNMYGYRLPESEQGMIFYEIYFPLPAGNKFLYPHVCVRSHVLNTPCLDDGDQLVHQFLRDLGETMPTVFEKPLQFSAEYKSFVNQSIHASNEEKLTPKTPEFDTKERITHRNLNSTTRLSFSRQSPPRFSLEREQSSLMSPTPSLRGFRTNESKQQSMRNVMSRIAKIHDPSVTPARLSWSLAIPRTTDDLLDIQNRCPNVESSDDVDITVKNEIDSSVLGSERCSMDTDVPELACSTFPSSSFVTANRRTFDGDSSTSIPPKQPRKSSNSTNETETMICDASKYFPAENKIAASKTAEKLSLREKLRRIHDRNRRCAIQRSENSEDSSGLE